MYNKNKVGIDKCPEKKCATYSYRLNQQYFSMRVTQGLCGSKYSTCQLMEQTLKNISECQVNKHPCLSVPVKIQKLTGVKTWEGRPVEEQQKLTGAGP